MNCVMKDIRKDHRTSPNFLSLPVTSFMPTYRLASWSFDPATLRSSFPVEIVDWWSDVSGALAVGFPIRVSQKLCEKATAMGSKKGSLSLIQ